MSRFKRTSEKPPVPKKGPPPRPPGSPFKIKIRGKDNAPLSMQDLRQGLYDIVRKLSPYAAYRARWVTVYLTLIDEDGNEVRINEKGEWTLYPYRSAADEQGV